jgi:hypothetical protein
MREANQIAGTKPESYVQEEKPMVPGSEADKAASNSNSTRKLKFPSPHRKQTIPTQTDPF